VEFPGGSLTKGIVFTHNVRTVGENTFPPHGSPGMIGWDNRVCQQLEALGMQTPRAFLMI
jgi:hypothetical protein